MKRIAIITAILFLTQVSVNAENETVNYNYYYHNDGKSEQAQIPIKTQPAASYEQAFVDQDTEFLLKYNIQDLEDAPWLNGGKRKLYDGKRRYYNGKIN